MIKIKPQTDPIEVARYCHRIGKKVYYKQSRTRIRFNARTRNQTFPFHRLIMMKYEGTMKPIVQLLAATGFIVVMCVTAEAVKQTPVQKHGWLKTEKGYLLNERGNIVQLRGMSFYWSNPAWQEGYKYYSAKTVDALVDQWKCTVVRVAYDRDSGVDLGWSAVETVIKAAINRGIYVIIDWHAHDANNYASAAIDFFTKQARLYRETPNVIFEPFNEPKTEPKGGDGSRTVAEATWTAIKGYLKNVTQAIRDEQAQNLVLIGTPYYCQYVNVAVADPIKDRNNKPFANIAYTFHFYAASHGSEAYYVKGTDEGGLEMSFLDEAAGRGEAIFISEWGTSHSDGGQNGHTVVDEENTKRWFDKFVNGPYHFSWCNWSVSDFQPSSAFSSGTTNPSTSGRIVQGYLNDTVDEYEPLWITGKKGPAQDTVFTIPAVYHQASIYNRYYGANAGAADVLYSQRDNIDRRIPLTGYTALKVTAGEDDSWVAYFIKSTSATENIVARYLAPDGAGTVEIMLDGVKAGQLDLQKTASWESIKVPLQIAPGEHTVKFNFVTTTGAGYLIEWFELCSTCTQSATSPRLQLKHDPATVTIASTDKGFALMLHPSHSYESYRLIVPDGSVAQSGIIVRGCRIVPIRDLACGVWVLELDGRAGRIVRRLVSRGR